jgi:predicted DNA-binding transcriptional regulator YafY
MDGITIASRIERLAAVCELVLNGRSIPYITSRLKELNYKVTRRTVERDIMTLRVMGLQVDWNVHEERYDVIAHDIFHNTFGPFIRATKP